MTIVCFHNEYEENGYLSNWYPSKFSINGIGYSSMEQYMICLLYTSPSPRD